MVGGHQNVRNCIKGSTLGRLRTTTLEGGTGLISPLLFLAEGREDTILKGQPCSLGIKLVSEPLPHSLSGSPNSFGKVHLSTVCLCWSRVDSPLGSFVCSGVHPGSPDFLPVSLASSLQSLPAIHPTRRAASGALVGERLGITIWECFLDHWRKCS